MLDTEGVEIEEFYYNGEKAMDWKKGEISSLLVYINDVDTLISGQIDREEAMKIADNIKIKK